MMFSLSPLLLFLLLLASCDPGGSVSKTRGGRYRRAATDVKIVASPQVKRLPASKWDGLEFALDEVAAFENEEDNIVQDAARFQLGIYRLPLVSNLEVTAADFSELKLGYRLSKGYRLAGEALEGLDHRDPRHRIFWEQACSQISLMGQPEEAPGEMGELVNSELYLAWKPRLLAPTLSALGLRLLAMKAKLFCELEVEIFAREGGEDLTLGKFSLDLAVAQFRRDHGDRGGRLLGALEWKSAEPLTLISVQDEDARETALGPVEVRYPISPELVGQAALPVGPDTGALTLTKLAPTGANACRYKVASGNRQLLNPLDRITYRASVIGQGNVATADLVAFDFSVINTMAGCQGLALEADPQDPRSVLVHTTCSAADQLYGQGRKCLLRALVGRQGDSSASLSLAKAIPLPPRAVTLDQNYSFPTGVCSPGTWRCRGEETQVCGSNGLWAAAVGGSQCQDPPRICTPGVQDCDDGDERVCSFDGTEWHTVETDSFACENVNNPPGPTPTPTVTPTVVVTPTPSTQVCYPLSIFLCQRNPDHLPRGWAGLALR